MLNQLIDIKKNYVSLYVLELWKGISVIIANDIINMHYYFLKHKISTCCSQN